MRPNKRVLHNNLFSLHRVPRNASDAVVSLISITARKSEEHQYVEEEELHNVHDHSRQGDLQRAEVRIHGEYVDELQRAATQRRSYF